MVCSPSGRTRVRTLAGAGVPGGGPLRSGADAHPHAVCVIRLRDTALCGCPIWDLLCVSFPVWRPVQGPIARPPCGISPSAPCAALSPGFEASRLVEAASRP
eukprot:4109536-Prymnesium_polylepis.1